MSDGEQTKAAGAEDWECVCSECGYSWPHGAAFQTVVPPCNACGSDDIVCQTVGSSDD